MSVRVDQYVPRFQIAMNDAFSVGVGDRMAYALEHGQLPVEVLSHRGQVFVEMNTFDEIHDIILRVCGRPGIETLHDPRRLDSLENGNLTVEPALLHCAGATENLQGDDPWRLVEAPGFVHHAEATTANFLDNVAAGDVGCKAASVEFQIAVEAGSTVGEVLVQGRGIFTRHTRPRKVCKLRRSWTLSRFQHDRHPKRPHPPEARRTGGTSLGV